MACPAAPRPMARAIDAHVLTGLALRRPAGYLPRAGPAPSAASLTFRGGLEPAPHLSADMRRHFTVRRPTARHSVERPWWQARATAAIFGSRPTHKPAPLSRDGPRTGGRRP